MTKAKTAAKKTAAKEKGAEATTASPAGQARINDRINGGVRTIDDRKGPERELAAKSGEMVTIPRLDHTLIDRGRKIYPSSEPVEIPYNLAVTYGLIGIAKGQATGRTTGQSLVTDEDKRPKVEQADNGQGGKGIPAGNAIPAVSVADQPPTLDEINQAAVDAGRDEEAVLKQREAEIQARRNARTGNEPDSH